MIVNRIGYHFRFALRAGVETANDALQLGEFANHFRGEIALGKFRGAVRIGDVRLHHAEVVPLLGEPAGNGAHAFDLGVVAAEARFVGDLVELGKDVRQPNFLIGLPEEARIGKARAQDAFVPGADQSLGILGQIDHRQEVRRQFPAALFHGEIFLVTAHHGDQDLVRQFEEGWIEAAFDDVRKFVEVGDQVQKVCVRVDVVAGAFNVGGQFALDLFPALGRPHNHAISAELLFVVGEILDGDFCDAEESVAYRSVSSREAAEGKLQGLAIQHAEQPADRADEARALQAGPRHGARPGRS